MPRYLLAIIVASLLVPTMAKSGPYGPNKALHMVERRFPLTPIGQFRLRFNSYQPQGLVKFGDQFFLSSLEIIERKGHENIFFQKDSRQEKKAHGRAHLFVFDRNGILHKDIHLAMGTLCHPGGMSHDGQYLWVPVSESWQYGHSMVLRINLETLNVQRVFTFDDHLAGVVVDKKNKRLFAWNWSSESWYVFSPRWTALAQTTRSHTSLRCSGCQTAAFWRDSRLWCPTQHGRIGRALTPIQIEAFSLPSRKDTNW